VCACTCGATFESGVFGAFQVGLDIYICVYLSTLKAKGDSSKRRSYPRVGCRYQRKCTLQLTATHCNTLQHVAKWNFRVQNYEEFTSWGCVDCNTCNTVQHTATHCNMWQGGTSEYRSILEVYGNLHCNTPQQTATNHSTAEHVASWDLRVQNYEDWERERKSNSTGMTIVYYFSLLEIQSAKYVCARVFVRVRVWVWVWVWVTYNQLNRR